MGFVPMGMAQWMKDNTVVAEDKETEIKIVMTPANHWCKRGLNDDNQMLWGSWAVIGPRTRFWFGGDTGYCEAFKQIGDKLGPFTMAAIPIGAYHPDWFMKYQHVNPAEAIQMHKDIRSEKSVGIHWGTFKMTTEFYLEPASLLKQYLKKNDMSELEFV